MRRALLVLSLVAGAAWGAVAPASPFLVVASPGARPGSLPLDSTRIEARVGTMFVDVVVTQRYTNRSGVPLEAVYVVPNGPGIAMHRFEVTVGDRVLRAHIERKQEARQQFVQARKQGKKASLLEQYGADAFRMSVANIAPGDAIVIELRYSQALEPAAGRYALAFSPPVPVRFNDERAGRDPAQGSFEAEVRIASSVPLIDVHASLPTASVVQESPTVARVVVARGEPPIAPLEIGYGLRGPGVVDGIEVARRGDQRYFLVQVQPPAVAAYDQALARDFIFVVDRASLGYGFTSEAYRYLMAQLLGALRPSDRFNVVVFDDAAHAFMPSPQHAGPEAIARSVAWLEDLEYGGWERKGFEAALDHALIPPRPAGTARTVVLVTDGRIALDGARLDALATRFLSANLVPFGVGWGIDPRRLAAIGRTDGYDAVILADVTRPDEEVRRLRATYATPLVTAVKVSGVGIELDGLTPATDLFAERPLLVLGRYRGEGTLVIEGESAAGPWRREYAVGAPPVDADGERLARAWARRRIDGLLDRIKVEERSSWIEEATQLALEFAIATPYTSFVAVEEKAPEPQPAPPPAVPPPSEGAMMALAARGGGGGGAGFQIDEVGVDPRASRASGPAPVPRTIRAPRGGPTVVAIMDAGRRDDPFYSGAARYYASRDALIVRDLGSLQELAQALARIARELKRPLGDVRIVVHGSQWTGLATAVAPGGADADGDGLALALERRLLAPLDASVLDAATRIRVEGCGLGRRPDLLEALARLLGGDDAERPAVASSRGFVEFALDGAPARRERPYVAAVTPGRRPPSTTDRAYPIRVRVSVADPAEVARAGVQRWIASQPGVREKLAQMGLSLADLAWRSDRGVVVGEGIASVSFAP